MPDLDLIVAIGGSGNQSAGSTAFPGVMLRSFFDAHDVDEWDGTNGAALVTGSSAGVTVFGASSGIDVGVAVLTGLDVTGLCIAVTAVSTTSDVGYYEITGHDESSVTVNTLSVDGVLTLVTGDSVSWRIGGSGDAGASSSLGLADDVVGLFLNSNTVEVLTNLDEPSSPAETLSSAGTVLYPLTYTGTIHDGSVVNNNFVRATDVSAQPVIDLGTAILTIGGAFVRFRNIVVTSAMITGNSGVVLVTGAMGIVDQCRISNTSTSASARAALRINNGAMISNCHVSTLTTRTSVDSAAVYTLARSHIVNNFITSTRVGIQVTGSVTQTACGNIIVGNDTGSGISVSLSSTRGFLCNYNSIYDFTEGINVSTAMSSPIGNVIFANNIIWGGTTGTVKGIANAGSATAIYFYINNNAIGNVDTAYEFGDLIIENVITLTVNPFAGSTFDSADEFKLNNTAGGGALCRETALPTDYDSDGTQDAWGDVGALQVEPTGGAGGGVMPLTGLLS